MPESDRTRRTYVNELWRAVASGILETAGTTFLLLIALGQFSAGATSKGLVYVGGALGLMLSPLVVSFVSARGWSASNAAGRIFAVGSGAFLLAALVPILPVFVVCSMIGMASSAAVIPLVTQIYQDNYPATERGRRFSRTVMVRILAAGLFGLGAGSVMSGHMERFQILLLCFAGAMAFGSRCLFRCPSSPITPGSGTHPLRALRYAVQDRVFRRLLISWMGMGFANLMMLPLRVEYLESDRHGLHYSAGRIALLTIVIPSLGRLLFSPLWGYLFDRINFFLLRGILNIGFALAILTFFLGGSWSAMVVGAVLYGISNAGGEVAWGLWVTKFAKPERVADYMSVHTFLTGVRGVCAPMLGFYLTAQLYSITTLAWISAGLIGAATLLLVGQSKRPELERG